MTFKKHFVLTDLGDEIIAVPMDTGEDDFRGIVRLNETGADIFRGIQAGLSEDEIAAQLVEMYDGLGPDRARTDVRALAEKFREAGLLD